MLHIFPKAVLFFSCNLHILFFHDVSLQYCNQSYNIEGKIAEFSLAETEDSLIFIFSRGQNYLKMIGSQVAR